MDWNPDPSFDFNNVEFGAEDFYDPALDFGAFDQGNAPIYDTNYNEASQGNAYYPSQGFETIGTPYQQPEMPYHPAAQVQGNWSGVSAQGVAKPKVQTHQFVGDNPYNKGSIEYLDKDLGLAEANNMPPDRLQNYDTIPRAQRIQNKPNKPSAGKNNSCRSDVAKQKKRERNERSGNMRKAAAAELNLSVYAYEGLPPLERAAARERVRAKGVIPPPSRRSNSIHGYLENRSAAGQTLDPSGTQHYARTAGKGATLDSQAIAGYSSLPVQHPSRAGPGVVKPSIETTPAPMLLQTAGQTLPIPQVGRNASSKGRDSTSPRQISPARTSPDSRGSQSRTCRAGSRDGRMNLDVSKSASLGRSAGISGARSSTGGSARDGTPRAQSGRGTTPRGQSSEAGSSWRGISSSPESSGRQASPMISSSRRSSDREVTPRFSPGPSPLRVATQANERRGAKGTPQISPGPRAQTKHGAGATRWNPASLRAASSAPGNIKPAPAYGIRRNDKAAKTLLGKLGASRVTAPKANSRLARPKTNIQKQPDQRSKKASDVKVKAGIAGQEATKKKEWDRKQKHIKDAQKKLDDQQKKWQREQEKMRGEQKKKEEKLKKKSKAKDLKTQKDAHKMRRVAIKARSSGAKRTVSKPSYSPRPKRKWKRLDPRLDDAISTSRWYCTLLVE